MDDVPRDVWVHEATEVRSSPIEGSGLFATDDVAAGTVVLRLGGRVVSTARLNELIAEADADPVAPYVDSLTVDEDAQLVLPPGTAAHFTNHSCDPNLWHVDTFTVVTRRDIRAGDELTLDYGTSAGADGLAMPCTCGSPICRGRATSEDWRRPELRERYRGHWVPALEARIERSRQEM